MIPPNFFHRIGYKIGTNHYINHCVVAVAIMLAIGLGSGGNWLAGAVGGAIFYWSRELAQYEIRQTKFEWMDAIYPTICVTILYFILT